MKLIFGLGNPGKIYTYTRHNIGFLTVDHFLRELGIEVWKKKYNALYSKTEVFGEKCIFAKPLTFMNNSGVSVAPFLRSLKLSSDNLIVIHDDVDIEEGKVKIKMGGGDGGHKGLRSIINEMGGDSDFVRIRIGIGRPPENVSVSDYVLFRVTKGYLKELIAASLRALEVLLGKDYEKACNLINK